MLDYCTQPDATVTPTTATVFEVAAILSRPVFGYRVELASERLAFLTKQHGETIRLWDNGGEMGAELVNGNTIPVFAPTRFRNETVAAQYGAPVVVAYRLVSQLNGSDENTLWEETAATLADILG